MGKAGWRGKTLYGINQELTFPPGIGMIINRGGNIPGLLLTALATIVPVRLGRRPRNKRR